HACKVNDTLICLMWYDVLNILKCQTILLEQIFCVMTDGVDSKLECILSTHMDIRFFLFSFKERRFPDELGNVDDIVAAFYMEYRVQVVVTFTQNHCPCAVTKNNTGASVFPVYDTAQSFS